MNHPLAAYCGDYCGRCPQYGTECRGCEPSAHPDCHFINCCQEKFIQHCGLCDEFPCETLRNFVPDNGPKCPAGFHVENLRNRVIVGTEAWIEAQQAKFEV